MRRALVGFSILTGSSGPPQAPGKAVRVQRDAAEHCDHEKHEGHHHREGREEHRYCAPSSVPSFAAVFSVRAVSFC